MFSFVIAGIVFVCSFGGAVLGMRLHTTLPEHYLNASSKDVIRVTSGLLATLVALVLGLLVASAKAEFDAQETGFQQLSSNIIVLDRMLGHYGPGAERAREALRTAVETTIKALWPEEGQPSASLDSAGISTESESLFVVIGNLTPTTDAQRTAQSQALSIGVDLARTRWMLSQQQISASSGPFLVVLLFWLFTLFASFGLFAPRNGAVLTAFFVSALSAAGAMFLIADLNRPSDGLIQVSSVPLRYAVSQLGK